MLERCLCSVDADIEALLLEADEAERDVQLALRSLEAGGDADAAAVDALEQSLAQAGALKEWCRAARAEAAVLLAQSR